MLGWHRYGFYKKRVGTCYAELVFLNSVGSMGHVVHSGASGVRNIEAIFVTIGWHRYGFCEKQVRTNYTELVFLHLVGSAFHIVPSGASGV
jgi:hypothetical protein